MKTLRQSLYIGAFLTTSIVGLYGCDQDTSDDSPTNDASVDTWVTSTPTVDGNIVRVNYKSNVADATFKCQVVTNGQPGEWQTCGTEGTEFPVLRDVNIALK